MTGPKLPVLIEIHINRFSLIDDDEEYHHIKSQNVIYLDYTDDMVANWHLSQANKLSYHHLLAVFDRLLCKRLAS